jgi:hypothetical protein
VGYCLFEKHQWSCRQSELWALLCIDKEFTCSFSEFLATALRDCFNAETDIQVGQEYLCHYKYFLTYCHSVERSVFSSFSDWPMFYEVGPKTGFYLSCRLWQNDDPSCGLPRLTRIPAMGMDQCQRYRQMFMAGFTMDGSVILYFDQRCHWFN